VSGPAADEPGVVWRDLWSRTADALGDRTAARWVCETASGADGEQFLTVLDEPASARMQRHLDEMVARRCAGEPLQYVLGHWGFRHLDLAVDRRVLIPRPETELVAGEAIARAQRVAPSRRVVDLGTGSGAIGLSLAVELPVTGTEVWLTDRDGDALDVARANLAGIGRSAGNVRIADGSWFDALPAGLRFDVVVSNPPYVAEGSPDLDPAVAEWEPLGALVAGPDGLDAIRAIVRDAWHRLAPGGSLVLEIGSDQSAAVRALLGDAGYDEVEIRPDHTGRARVAVAVRPA
jgi:release factor glutamine methyltransferase